MLAERSLQLYFIMIVFVFIVLEANSEVSLEKAWAPNLKGI